MSLGAMLGDGMLFWLLIWPLSSSAQVYAGEGERRYCAKRASSSDTSPLTPLEPSPSIRDVVERLPFGWMPASEEVSSESEGDVDRLRLSSGNRSSSNLESRKETSDGFDDIDVGSVMRSGGLSESVRDRSSFPSGVTDRAERFDGRKSCPSASSLCRFKMLD